jgi:hypothetical protein
MNVVIFSGHLTFYITSISIIFAYIAKLLQLHNSSCTWLLQSASASKGFDKFPWFALIRKLAATQSSRDWFGTP